MVPKETTLPRSGPNVQPTPENGPVRPSKFAHLSNFE